MQTFLYFCIPFFLSISLTLNSTAQDYAPMVIENATWINFQIDYFTGLPSYSAYKIKRDTIMNNVDLKKIYSYRLIRNLLGDYIVINRSVAGVIREDISSKKVYGGLFNNNHTTNPDSTIYLNCNTEEYILKPIEDLLLYDFSLTVGDSIVSCQYEASNPNSPILEDKTEFLFGEDRRVIKSQDYAPLIEGVGYTLGFFKNPWYIIIPESASSLINYCVGTYMDCDILSSINNFDKENSISLFPNPATEYLNIKSDINFTKFNIFDFSGHSLLKGDFDNSVNIQLLFSGIYILELTNKKGERVIKRFIKS